MFSPLCFLFKVCGVYVCILHKVHLKNLILVSTQQRGNGIFQQSQSNKGSLDVYGHGSDWVISI